MFKKSAIIFIFFSIPFAVMSQTTRKYSNEFLNIGVDARSMAMGNSVVSNVGDVTAGYWNPAGLVHSEIQEIGLMHAAYFANIAQYDYAGFVHPIDEDTALGLTLIRFGVDDIMDTTELIDSEGNVDYNNINLFSAADYGLMFSFAKKPLRKDFTYGINAKVIYRHIGKFASAIGFGFDAGWQLHKDDWTFGVMVRDITTTFNAWRFNEDELSKIQDAIPDVNQDLPEKTEITIPKAQLGVGKDWNITRDIGLHTALDVHMRFTQTNDVINSEFVSVSPSFGFEADYLDMVYLRGGVNNVQNELQFDNTEQITLQPNVGVGFAYYGIKVDYALTNIASSGNAFYSHVFSLKLDLDLFRK